MFTGTEANGSFRNLLPEKQTTDFERILLSWQPSSRWLSGCSPVPPANWSLCVKAPDAMTECSKISEFPNRSPVSIASSLLIGGR